MRPPRIFSRKLFWSAFAAFFVLLSLIDYHYSTVNQIPSDGPLTSGFPLTFRWMMCPMSAGGAGACRSGMSFLGLAVDGVLCMVCALAAAALGTRIAGRDFAKTRIFWIRSVVVCVLLFMLTSAVSLLRSASHGRAIEMGFPAVYLREYAGESWSAMNLAMDLAICLAAALLCVALFPREKS